MTALAPRFACRLGNICWWWERQGLKLTMAPADIGANASAEEAEEALEDTAVKVNNIVNSFRLQSTSFDKKGYLTYLKGN